jgi:hypothetical protein
MTIAQFLLLFWALWQAPSAPTGLRVGNKMAITIGTNAGFVTAAPTSDPGGTGLTLDDKSAVMIDTVPATAAKITKVGFWVDNATEETNLRVALYDNDGATVPGEAGTRLYLSSDFAKGTGAGWKEITVDWDVSAYVNTSVWIGLGIDNTATSTTVDHTASGGPNFDVRNGASAMPNPYAGGAIAYVAGKVALYAVWEAAPAGGLSIPVAMASYRRKRQ